MTTTVEINDSSSSSSSSAVDLQPQIRQQFGQLAETLKETNTNLLSFEFMLGQYKRLAKVSPLLPQAECGRTGGRPDPSESIVVELKSLGRSIEGLRTADARPDECLAEVRELAAQIRHANEAKRDPDEAGYLRGRIVELESQIQIKDARCTALSEANNRLSRELAAERERIRVLDQKVESEKKAAQAVGRDITRYVSHVNALEAELSRLKSEAKVEETGEMAEQAPTESKLCQTCLIDDSELDFVASKVGDLAEELQRRNADLTAELEKERAEKSALAVIVSQRSDNKSDRRLARLKLELAEARADRDTLGRRNERLAGEAEVLANRLKACTSSHSSLKAKSRSLVQQYRSKRQALETCRSKLAAVKGCLENLSRLCRAREEHELALLNHLGVQIEISGRLLAAYVDVDCPRPSLALSEPLGRPKTHEWFCNVQALSVWTHRQLVAFGKRSWAAGCDDDAGGTLSELSHTLEFELGLLSSEKDVSVVVLPEAVQRALDGQDDVERQARMSVETIAKAIQCEGAPLRC